jgi:hypothetical protein
MHPYPRTRRPVCDFRLIDRGSYAVLRPITPRALGASYPLRCDWPALSDIATALTRDGYTLTGWNDGVPFEPVISART